MHSIVGQGKVEQVLASKPEDRRAFVEEAAGLGKFKRRRHRAELKLARVALQVERARDVEDEVRKRLRPLALQATAAERAEKLGARDRCAPRASRAARPRGLRGHGAPRPRSGGMPPLSRGEEHSHGSRVCSPIARARRTSSRTPPDAARPPSPRCYRLQGGIERLGAPRRIRLCAARAVPRVRCPRAPDQARRPTTRCVSSSRPFDAAEAARIAEREPDRAGRACGARARAHACARTGTRRAGGPPSCRASARGAGCAACARRHSTSTRAPSDPSRLRSGRARLPSSPTIPPWGSRFSSALAQPGSAA